MKTNALEHSVIYIVLSAFLTCLKRHQYWQNVKDISKGGTDYRSLHATHEQKLPPPVQIGAVALLFPLEVAYITREDTCH